MCKLLKGLIKNIFKGKKSQPIGLRLIAFRKTKKMPCGILGVMISFATFEKGNEELKGSIQMSLITV